MRLGWGICSCQLFAIFERSSLDRLVVSNGKVRKQHQDVISWDSSASDCTRNISRETLLSSPLSQRSESELHTFDLCYKLVPSCGSNRIHVIRKLSLRGFHTRRFTDRSLFCGTNPLTRTSSPEMTPENVGVAVAVQHSRRQCKESWQSLLGELPGAHRGNIKLVLLSTQKI